MTEEQLIGTADQDIAVGDYGWIDISHALRRVNGNLEWIAVSMQRDFCDVYRHWTESDQELWFSTYTAKRAISNGEQVYSGDVEEYFITQEVAMGRLH